MIALNKKPLRSFIHFVKNGVLHMEEGANIFRNTDKKEKTIIRNWVKDNYPNQYETIGNISFLPTEPKLKLTTGATKIIDGMEVKDGDINFYKRHIEYGVTDFKSACKRYKFMEEEQQKVARNWVKETYPNQYKSIGHISFIDDGN